MSSLLEIQSILEDFKNGKQDLQETINRIGFLMLQREGKLVKKVLAKASEQALVRIEYFEDKEEVISKVSGTYIDSQWVEVDKESILNLKFNNEDTI